MQRARGKLIVLYGINNLGKSTQAKLLVEKLRTEGKTAEYIKYPTYQKDPSGVILNDYLRGGNPYGLSAREAQIFYAFNRAQTQTELLELLDKNDFVVAEDYWGTGVAWGTGAGVDYEFLKRINAFCYREDLAFLFYGTRFAESIEQGHTHESDTELVEKVREVHERLAEEYGWVKVNANESIEQVGEVVWSSLKSIL